MSAINISLAGMLGAQDRFEASARRIVATGVSTGAKATGTDLPGTETAAYAGTSGAPEAGQGGIPPGPDGVRFSSDLAGAMIEMLSAEHSFRANAAAAGRIADAEREVLETLASGTRARERQG
jgi:hypothetical protein